MIHLNSHASLLSLLFSKSHLDRSGSVHLPPLLCAQQCSRMSWLPSESSFFSLLHSFLNIFLTSALFNLEGTNAKFKGIYRYRAAARRSCWLNDREQQRQTFPLPSDKFELITRERKWSRSKHNINLNESDVDTKKLEMTPGAQLQPVLKLIKMSK